MQGRLGEDRQRTAQQGMARQVVARTGKDATVKEAVQKELEAIYSRHGALNPEDVVDAARNKRSALHGQFKWNDSDAAHEYRLIQARKLIRVAVTVIPALSNEPVKQFVSIKGFRGSREGSYIATVDLLSDDEKYEMALNDAIQDLERLRHKYEHLSELIPVWSALDRAITKVAKAA